MAAKHLLKLPAKHKFKDIKGPIPYHILPSLNNTYDIGSAAQRWRDLHIRDLYPYGVLRKTLEPYDDSVIDLGTGVRSFRTIWTWRISSRWTIILIDRDLFPDPDGILALGDPTARWKEIHTLEIYIDNKLRMPRLAADPTLAEGLLWLRTDLDRLKYSPDGVSAKLIPLVLDDIQDVEAPSPSDGQVLTYEAATSLWKAKSPGAAVAEYYMLMAEEVKEDSATYNLAKASWNSAHCHWSYCAVKDFFDGTWKVALNACLTAPMLGGFVSAVIYYWDGSSWAELGSEISHSNGTAVKEGDFVTIPSNCKLLAMYTSSTETYGYIRGASYHFKKA